MAQEKDTGGLRGVLAWTGAGLLFGALAWLGVVARVNDGGLVQKAGGWWMVSTLIAVLVLARGVRWRRGDREAEADRYVFWMCPAAGVGTLVALLAFPEDAFEATTHGPWSFQASPVAVHLWLVASAIALGCVLMLLGWRRPDPRPLRRTAPLLGAGVLAVSLAGASTAWFLVPWVPHHVADGLGEPAPVPSEVSRLGWEWRSPMGTKVDEVYPGSHGPLVLLYDGAVALDGGTGEELWSYRRPHDRVRDVWVEDGRVHVRHRVGTDDSGDPGDPGGEELWETVVLDAGTGEILEEGSDAETPSTGWMFEHGRTLVEDLLDLPEHCVVSHAQGYGHRLVGVFGCLDDADTETVERSMETGNAFGWDHVETQATVVSLDPLEGTEHWRTEWTAPPSSTGPRLTEAPGGAAGSPVIVRYGPQGRSTVLDPDTGQALVTTPEELVNSEDLIGVVHADAHGAVFASDTGDLETTFHRVDPSGEITDTAVVEEAYLASAVGSARIAVLGESLVITRGVAKLVLAVPFGETTHWRDGVVLELEREGDLGVVAVPGAAVLVSGDRYSSLVEGLVP